MPSMHHASACRRGRVDARSAAARVIARTSRRLRLAAVLSLRGRFGIRGILDRPAARPAAAASTVPGAGAPAARAEAPASDAHPAWASVSAGPWRSWKPSRSAS